MFSFCWVFINYFWYQITRIKKYILHLISGKSEIERILSGKRSKTSTVLLENSISNSFQLMNIQNEKKKLNFKKYTPDEVVNEILKTKKIGSPIVISNLKSSIHQIYNVELAIEKIEKIQKEKYDSSNETHENLLMELWENLSPNVKLTKRKCKDWSKIGFQGEDPATDFRAMGMLGLLNLIYFSKYEKVQKVLQDSNSEFWYPFAVCGINVSSKISDLLRSHQLNSYFYDSKDYLNDFNEIYVDFFVGLNDFLMKKQSNVMKFNENLEEYLKIYSYKF
eukprot:gene6840-11001_t